jgi:hypothetical protein
LIFFSPDLQQEVNVYASATNTLMQPVANSTVQQAAPQSVAVSSTEHFSPPNDDDLIDHLRGSVKSIEELYVSHGGGIIDIVNRLAERKTYHSYSKIFTAILKYFLLVVQRYCQGDV